MTTIDTPLLGVALDRAGGHPAAARDSALTQAELVAAERLVELARRAELAGFTFATLDDRWSQVEPDGRVVVRPDAVLAAARLAPATEALALLPSVPVTHTEPFHVSKNIATLDLVSGGRAGWQPTLATSQAEADLIGRKEAAPTDDLVDEAIDVVEVVRRLWDSWEDDAVVRDRDTGRYVDRDRLHTVDFVGRFFSVRGPSITPRPPQGQPVVAVTVRHRNDPFVELAARHADLVLVNARSVDEALLARRSVLRTAAVHGRGHDDIRAVVVADVLIEADRPAAHRERERLDRIAAGAPEGLDIVGIADDVLALIDGVRAVGFDGALLRPARLPQDLHRLAAEVLPRLLPSAPASVTSSAPPPTFRERLGLARPVDRYAAPVTFDAAVGS